MIHSWFLTAILLIFTMPGWSVIVLDSTYKKSGFKQAEALALLPQFSSLIYLEADSGTVLGLG